MPEPRSKDPNPLSSLDLDLDRQRRCGYSEVIYGEGKSFALLIETAQRLTDAQQPVLITRIAAELFDPLASRFPASTINRVARTLRLGVDGAPLIAGRVAVITAGSTDQPVAEEAAETLRFMGFEPTMIFDCGVAGPHRLPRRVPEFVDCDCVVVVAGMEGALPSVVAGYVSCPVIAVPTSVGYGANLGGVAALLSMINSCAANVAVVNIDAGFKGGYMAGLIASRAARGTGRIR